MDQYLRETSTRKCVIKVVTLVLLIISVIFIAVGIDLMMVTSPHVISSEQSVNYTDCEKLNVFDSDYTTCANYTKNHYDGCVCFFQFNLTADLIGDVVLYYELDDYDQSRSPYVLSRDNNQLSGHLSLEPAQECEPFRYDNITNKPILPCGAIADSMFNDTFELRLTSEDTYKSTLDYGMIMDKSFYRNPPRNGTQSLETVFQNFSKPKNWKRHIWELDPLHEENNGLENERFIGWMDTNLKRKPVWRLDSTKHDRLQKNEYTMRIGYDYPSSVYAGQRKFILSATLIVNDNRNHYGAGVGLLVTGIVCFLFAIIIIAVLVRESGWKILYKWDGDI